MSDIVERLRNYDKRGDWEYIRNPAVCEEAADEIERLRQRVAELDRHCAALRCRGEG